MGLDLLISGLNSSRPPDGGTNSTKQIEIKPLTYRPASRIRGRRPESKCGQQRKSMQSTNKESIGNPLAVRSIDQLLKGFQGA